MRNIPGEIRPECGLICLRIGSPVSKCFFAVAPGNELTAEAAKSFDYPSGNAQLPGCIRLTPVLRITEGMAEEYSPIKMADNRQERIRQNGKGLPWALG